MDTVEVLPNTWVWLTRCRDADSVCPHTRTWVIISVACRRTRRTTIVRCVLIHVCMYDTNFAQCSHTHMQDITVLVAILDYTIDDRVSISIYESPGQHTTTVGGLLGGWFGLRLVSTWPSHGLAFFHLRVLFCQTTYQTVQQAAYQAKPLFGPKPICLRFAFQATLCAYGLLFDEQAIFRPCRGGMLSQISASH